MAREIAMAAGLAYVPPAIVPASAPAACADQSESERLADRIAGDAGLIARGGQQSGKASGQGVAAPLTTGDGESLEAAAQAIIAELPKASRGSLYVVNREP